MAIQISLPENLFDSHQASFLRQRKIVNKFKAFLAKEKERLKELGLSSDNDATRNFKQRIAIENGKLKSIKNEIDTYWDYTLLRAINPEKYKFNHKTFLDDVSAFLGIERQEVMRKKRRIVNLGFATIEGKDIIFTSKDRVWEHYGVLISKHKKDENGKRLAHQSLGVFKEAGSKTIAVKKGQTNSKTGREYKKDHKFTFKKKLHVKVLKFSIEPNQLSKTNLKRQAMLAFCKLNLDRAVTRLQLENLREIEQENMEINLTCDYLAKKVGYTSSVSGWSGRTELEDTGFIDINKNKVEIESNIQYVDAKEKYNLQGGIDEITGYAYYYDKKQTTVFGVKCYGIIVNSYQPICYRKQPSVKKETKRWEKWYEGHLKACDGCAISKMFGRDYHLFEIESISGYLLDLLERNEKFIYSDYQKWNSKKVEALV